MAPKNDICFSDTRYTTKNRLVTKVVNALDSEIGRCVDGSLRILDVGCGEGYLIWKLGLKNAVGIDLSEKMIKRARKNLPNARFLVGSAYSLPFPDKSFDVVICSQVLEHLEHPELVLQEISRVTRKFAVLSVPEDFVSRALNIMRGQFLKYWGGHPGHINSFSLYSFTKLVSRYFRIKISKVVGVVWLLCIAVPRGSEG